MVLELMKSLWNKGYNIYCNNFYTSPSLYLKLEEKSTGCCGTVRINCKGIPTSFQQKKHKKGEKSHTKTGGVKWMDKRGVTAISTIHTGEMSTVSRSRRVSGGVETIQKPTMSMSIPHVRLGIQEFLEELLQEHPDYCGKG